MAEKVLIADDSKLSRKKIKDTLIELGYSDFIEASNGQEAIDMYMQESPLFVTLDIEMPLFDGIQVVKELVQVSDSLRVIWISSVENKHRILEAQKLCKSSIVKKPLKKEYLENAIKLVLRGN